MIPLMLTLPILAADVSLDDVREKLGVAAYRDVEALLIEGDVDFFGIPSTFSLLVAPDGRFRREIRGRLREVTVFDGDGVWRLDDSGIPYPLQLYMHDFTLVEAWLPTGLWAMEMRGLDVEPDEEAFVLRRDHGPFDGRVTLDTGLRPDAFVREDFTGRVGIELGDYREELGLQLPHRFTVTAREGITHTFEVKGVKKTRVPEGAFDRPAPDFGDTHFDADTPARLEVKRASTGHLFVRPLIDGKDVGLFVFDTGAAVSVISPSVADELEMETFGKTALSGGGEEVHDAAFRQGKSLELGPLRIDGVVWNESESVVSLGSVIGEKVGGVVGWDVLIRSVVELDLTRSEIALFDPRGYELPEGSWQELLLHRRHPWIHARFEGDRDGVFAIDSGAGNMAVIFHTPTVDELGLLEGRETFPVQAMGAGGAIALEYGRLEWFEVGGHRVSTPNALFCRDERGALADPYVQGTLGHAFFEPFTLAFDYGSGRIGFIRRE